MDTDGLDRTGRFSLDRNSPHTVENNNKKKSSGSQQEPKCGRNHLDKEKKKKTNSQKIIAMNCGELFLFFFKK